MAIVAQHGAGRNSPASHGIIALMETPLSAHAITLFGIPNCDSVKKARAWLDANDQAYVFHDFKKMGVPRAALSAWAQQLGWEILLNRKGTTWRKLDGHIQARASDAQGALNLMVEYSSVIKRPVIQWPGGQLTVGFDPQAFAAMLT